MAFRFGLYAVLGIAVFAVLAFLLIQSGFLENVPISGHGYFAFGLAAVLSILLSAGLFALTFFSAKSGHDDITDL